MIIKVAIITNYAPHYRLPLWSSLSKNKSIDYCFFSSSLEKNGIKPISDYEFDQNNIQFKNLKNINFQCVEIWQVGVLKVAWKREYTHFIFLGNMYCLSTWFAAIVLRVSGKKVIFWGHGLYGNELWSKKKIRILFYKLANYHLLYNNRAKELLIQEKFDANSLYVVYNSLDYELQRKIFNTLNKRYLDERKQEIFGNSNKTIIFIGRITKEKKLDLLIDSLNILKSKGSNFNLLIVGDGSEINHIKMACTKNGLENVKFWGPCYNEYIIGELIGLADLTVSPGNVGLTAIHSLTYGTPVITHNDFKNQGPEVEIIEEDITGAFFKKNNYNSLAEEIIKWFEKHPSTEKCRASCRKNIDKYYNPQYQNSVFNDLILDL